MEHYKMYQTAAVDDDLIRRCWDYAKKHDLRKFTVGRYAIDGDDLYVNIAEYNTKPLSDCIWEAHKAYFDVQILLSGREKLYVDRVENMRCGAYESDKDFVPCFGEPQRYLDFKESDCIVLLPGEAHMTGVSATETPTRVKKAVFKVKVCVNE